jgi:hypothetical protein
MSMVLTTSTSETMRPDGPLAQLACAPTAVEPPVSKSAFPPLAECEPLSFARARGRPSDDAEARLGSPFVARTYGPSSSQAMDPFLDHRSPPPRGGDLGTAGRFPFDQPRSLNGTQKRRAQHDLDEELSPHGAIVRPSVLNDQLFGTPLNSRRVRSRGFSLGDEAFRRGPSMFHSSFGLDAPPARTEIVAPHSTRGTSSSAPMLLPPPAFDPPRLGSPFTESKTFPRRVFPDSTTTIRRNAFATMHHSRRSIESFDFGRGASLQSRLQNLEQRLNQIQEREAAASQRGPSP